MAYTDGYLEQISTLQSTINQQEETINQLQEQHDLELKALQEKVSKLTKQLEAERKKPFWKRNVV